MNNAVLVIVSGGGPSEVLRDRRPAQKEPRGDAGGAGGGAEGGQRVQDGRGQEEEEEGQEGEELSWWGKKKPEKGQSQSDTGYQSHAWVL